MATKENTTPSAENVNETISRLSTIVDKLGEYLHGSHVAT